MSAAPPSRRPKRAPAPPQDRGLSHELMQQIQDNQGDPDFMTSLGRGLVVLSVFSQHPREVTMSQISTETGISRAAVRRVLYTLEKLGYVGEQGRGFVLLPRVLGMGGAYVASSSMTAAAQPVLDALRDDVHESCSLGVLDGDDVLYVARAETVRIMSIGLRAGSRLPAYCTSMGRVLLAALPHDTLESYLERNPLRPRTERTVTRMDEFLDTLERVRREGVCAGGPGAGDRAALDRGAGARAQWCGGGRAEHRDPGRADQPGGDAVTAAATAAGSGAAVGYVVALRRAAGRGPAVPGVVRMCRLPASGRRYPVSFGCVGLPASGRHYRCWAQRGGSLACSSRIGLASANAWLAAGTPQ